MVYDSTDQYTNWGVNVSNDGGQIESPTLMNYNNIFEPQYQRGKWVLWGSGNDYCYTISDAEQSYDSTKLDRFRRRVLFYKPDHVLVLDHVHLRNVGTAQRDAKWVLHFQKQPTINGNLLNAAVPGHIETFDGRDIVQANGNGNVAIRTLLPASSRTTRVGGTGYEFWVDGTNYPVGVNMDTVHTTDGGASRSPRRRSPTVWYFSIRSKSATIYSHPLREGSDSKMHLPLARIGTIPSSFSVRLAILALAITCSTISRVADW
ncbi:MAG: hypothetical protein RLZZ519_1865 [Bacteroidota bacterium]